jgi:hypothetical protein
MTSHSIHHPSRQLIARLMTDLCDRKITGRQFVRGVEDINTRGDESLAIVQEWVISTFNPDFERPAFNRDDPPYYIRRKLALMRRFVLSDVKYEWPKDAFNGDTWPTLRLITAGIVCATTIFSIPLAVAFPVMIPVTLALIILTSWLLIRESDASRADTARQHLRASQFGNPDAWPFLAKKDLCRARIPSRRAATG